MNDGLSQMKVTALFSDSRGYLWIGTRNGLNKFNGEKFEIFTTEDGLSHNRIHKIKEDESGNLVILTYAGVDIFDGGKFRSYPKPFNNVLYDFEVENINKIWICDNTTEGKLWLLKNGKYHLIYNAIKKDRLWLSFQYDRINNRRFLSKNDSLFIVKDSIIEFINKGFIGLPIEIGDLNNKIVLSKKENKNKFGLYYFDKKKIIKQAEQAPEKEHPVLIKNIKKNDIWMYHKNILDLPGFDDINRIRYVDKFVNVNDVIRYNNNQYWAATETGLVQIYNKAFQSFSYKDLPNIWTIIEDDKKDMYFGSYEGNLYTFDGVNSTFSKVKTGVNYFAGSAKDDENRLYFAKSYSLEIKEGDEYKNIWEKTTFSVYYDSIRDRIIFGTFDGVGIFSDPDSIKYIGPEKGMHQCGYIQTVGMDKEGYYWAGSYTGVNRIDPVTYKTNLYTQENGKLNSKGIFCTFLDDSGNFWLGGDNGLMYYDYSRDSIILIESQLLNTRVKSMIDFDGKKLLLGTKEGLYIFDTYLYLNDNKIKLYYFNSSNGYTGIDPGFTGMYKDSKGYIWICSSTSVDRLNPRKIILKDQQPDILITKFNEKRIPFEHSKLILKNKYNDANSIIKFEAIGFEHPLNTKYQYRLNKSPWSKWQNEDQVILKDLSKGNYTFEVRAGPTDEPLESEKIDKLMFTINLPFYRSSWFLPFVFGLTALLIILTGFYYYSQRKEHKMYLKQLKEARYLRSQLLLSELNPHFIFNVLATIQNKILFEEKELASEYVVKLSKLMRNFLNASHRANLMSSGKPDYEMQLSKEIELLKGFIEFEQIKSNYHFDYHIDIDKDIEPGYIMLPPMLIQPFVENSIKHGLLMSDKKGNLMIKIEKNENDLVINIEDDGIGIAESMKIHKKYNKAHKSLGSKIVMERIELLNKLGYQISIDILNRKPNGTIIKIILKDEL